MTLAQLQAFVASAALRTFTSAAAQLNMSQPAISDLIRRLEHELGTPLFHRGTRSLVLTVAGEQLLPHAEQALASAASGRRAVLSQVGLMGGIATFGLLRNAEFYIGTDLATYFRQRYPDVRIRLTGQNSAETAADVAAGVLDAGLVTLPVAVDGLEVVPLARDEVVYVTANSDRAATAVSTEVFCAAPLVLYDAHFATSDPARRQLAERAQLAGLKIEPEIEVEYLSTALALVRGGHGDSIVCRAAISAGLVADGLHIVPFEVPVFDVVALVKRRGATLAPATREMAHMAVEALIEHQSGPAGTATIIAETRQLATFFGAPARTSAP